MQGWKQHTGFVSAVFSSVFVVFWYFRVETAYRSCDSSFSSVLVVFGIFDVLVGACKRCWKCRGRKAECFGVMAIQLSFLEIVLVSSATRVRMLRLPE